MSDTNSFSATRARKVMWRLSNTTAFKRYGVNTSEKANCIMSTGLPRPGLARLAYRGRIKLLRGYVSKSSAALNTVTHAASLPARGRY